LEFINTTTSGYTITLNQTVTVNYVLVGPGGYGRGVNYSGTEQFALGGGGGYAKGSFNLQANTPISVFLGTVPSSGTATSSTMSINGQTVATCTGGSIGNYYYQYYMVESQPPYSNWKLNNTPTQATAGGTATVATGYGTGYTGKGGKILVNGNDPVDSTNYSINLIQVPTQQSEVFDNTTINYGIFGATDISGQKGGGGGWSTNTTQQNGTSGGFGYFLLYFTKTTSGTTLPPKITLTNSYIQFPDGSQQTSASSGTGSGTGSGTAGPTGPAGPAGPAGPTGSSPWITSGSDISYNAGNISTTKTITAATFNTSSDYRIKENVETLDLNVYRTEHLRPVSYLNKLNNKYSLGLIAHELQEHYSFLVEGEKDGEKFQSVDYIGIIAILIKEIQELKTILKKNNIE
jgi:hypothetical protein